MRALTALVVAGSRPAFVAHNPCLHRYQLHVDRQVAGLTAYERQGEPVVFTHTELAERVEGRGLAARLVSAALDDVPEHRGSVLPFCPYVRSYIAGRPEYLDLVPPGVRAAFELEAGGPARDRRPTSSYRQGSRERRPQ